MWICGLQDRGLRYRLTGVGDQHNHRGPEVLSGHVPRRGVLYITGSLAIAIVAGLIYYRELAVVYHSVRLRSAPGYMLRLVDADPDSPGQSALEAYLETREGRSHLRESLIRRMLADLARPASGSTTAPLDTGSWTRLELEVRRLHYDEPTREWWVLYAAGDETGRRAAGSSRADNVLVAIERHVNRVESGDAPTIVLPEYPELEFDLQASEVEEGEWRVLGRRRA